jgi:putative endonuclease
MILFVVCTSTNRARPKVSPNVTMLIYFECFDEIEQAIHREKRLKKWTRAWKISLIEKDNPNWIDLYPEIAGG